MPVVVFGDEGGVHVVAKNMLQLLRLLTYDVEISVDDDEACFYKDEDDYEESEDQGLYREWLTEEFSERPVKKPNKIIKTAQEKYKSSFDRWMKQYEGGKREEPVHQKEQGGVPDERRVPNLRVTFEPGGDGERASRVGGAPSDWGDGGWPCCPDCGLELLFVAQVCGPLSVGPVTFAEGEAVQVFSCWYDDRGSSCLGAGPSIAVVRDVGVSGRTRPGDGRDGAEAFDSHRMVTTPGFDDSLLLSDDDAEPGEYGQEDAYTAATCDKLGGLVAAGNDPVPATCEICGSTLVLLAQLGSDEAVPNPTGLATWIVRVCPDKHEASAAWVD